MIPQGMGTFSTIGNLILIIFIFWSFWGYPPPTPPQIFIIISQKPVNRPVLNCSISSTTAFLISGTPLDRSATSNYIESFPSRAEKRPWEASYRIFRRKTCPIALFSGGVGMEVIIISPKTYYINKRSHLGAIGGQRQVWSQKPLKNLQFFAAF